MKELWQEVARAGVQEEDSTVSGILLLVGGFLLAPLLIGIPMMIVGAYKLLK